MTAHAIPVVLIHGLGRTTASMRPLAWRLSRAGWRVRRLGYPSTKLTVQGSLDHVRAQLNNETAPFDIVGHSLGGLLGARLLRENALPVRRIVQLGSPNLGSPVADRLGGTWPLKHLCGPALEDLNTHDDEPEANDAIAAIAGIAGPDIPGAGLELPHDGAVSQRSAWAGAGHCVSVNTIHTTLPVSISASRLTAAFLSTGHFPEEST